MVGSCFGIFFSGEDTGTGQTMQTVVREINEDYENQLDTIKANISYDVLEMSGSRAVWPEVLLRSDTSLTVPSAVAKTREPSGMA